MSPGFAPVADGDTASLPDERRGDPGDHPPLAVYLMVGVVIGLESLGIPLPGEIVLVSAALLSSRHTLDISPVWVGVSATIGAIIGDTIGYTIVTPIGMSLFRAAR